MHQTFRSAALLAAITAFTTVTGLAQSSGQAIYKEKCLNCHGPSGLADGGVGRLMKVKPISDPEVKKLTEAEMIQTVRAGSGKMQPYKDELTDAQIKATVDYLRSFAK
jgi:mono/diheme cytochrome c family protein